MCCFCMYIYINMIALKFDQLKCIQNNNFFNIISDFIGKQIFVLCPIFMRNLCNEEDGF